MYISSKKYTKEGRTRFGSAIFIDDLKENKIDKLSGFQRNQGLLISIVLLIISKIASANYLGFLITIPLFITMYFYGSKQIDISYTDQRILIEKEYLQPRLVRIVANTLIGIAIFVPTRWILDIDQLGTRLEYMASVFQFLDLYDARFFLYRNLIRENYIVLQSFDSILTMLICVWFAIQYRNIRFEFREVNLKHVPEQLIKLNSINSMKGIVSLVFGYLIIQFLYFTRFSLGFLILWIFLFQIIPRRTVIQLSLIGPSNREILHNVVLSPKEFPNLSRTTAVTFGWEPQKEDKKKTFPHNIVPQEVASIYETGLRSYSTEATKQANYIGLTISTIINILVIAQLIRFAIRFNIQVFDIIFFFALALAIISLGVFVSTTGLSIIRKETQKDEFLLIGEKFVGRYTGNSLWILSGRNTEGTTVQRGRTSKLFRFDTTRGFNVEWERFTLLLILAIITIAIGIWNYLGAINLGAVPFIFPSLIDLGLEFLEQKASAELEFFAIAGYVIWVLTLIFYPRYYARTRPSLYIDMEYASVEPIVLKDFQEHQNASMQFTKSLISASTKKIRSSASRPGSFVLDLQAKSQLGEGTHLKFYVGENHRIQEVDLPLDDYTSIMDHIIVSGLKGYPELKLIIELYNSREECIFSRQDKLQILYQNQLQKSLEFGIFGRLDLLVIIKKQKS